MKFDLNDIVSIKDKRFGFDAVCIIEEASEPLFSYRVKIYQDGRVWEEEFEEDELELVEKFVPNGSFSY